MADNIRGLTIDFSADTSQFKKELKTFNQSLNASQKEAKALQESLELKFDADKFKKAQDVIQKSIQDTAYKADVLRKRMQDMDNALGYKFTDNQIVEYQKLQAELEKTELSAQKLEAQLKQLNQIKIDNLADGFNKVGSAATKVGQALMPISIAAGAATAAIGANTLKTIEFADELNTVANQLGITTEQLQMFRYIAMQTDVSEEKLTQGFVKLRSTIGEALIGQSNAGTQALQQLGFSLDELQGKSADQLFTETVSKLSQVQDATIQATLANQIFGERVANDLIPLLKVGGDGLNQLTKEFESVGFMTNEEINKLAAFDDTMNRIKATLGNISHEIGIAFLPVFQQIADFMESRVVPALRNFSSWMQSLSTGQKDLILGIGLVLTALAPALLIFGKLSTSIGSLINAFGSEGLTTVLKSLLGPVGIIIGLFALLYSTSEDFRNAINNLIGAIGEALQPVISGIVDTLGLLMQALNPVIQLIGSKLAMVINAITPAIELIGKLLVPIVNILVGILAPILAILSPILTLIVNILTIGIDIVAGLTKWIFNLANSFFDLIYKALKPAIEFLGGIWDAIMKILGIDGEEVKVKASVSYNQSSLDGISGAMSSQSALQDVINNNNSMLNNTNYNTVNNDYSNKNVSVQLTVNNYAQEADIDGWLEEINMKLAEKAW